MLTSTSTQTNRLLLDTTHNIATPEGVELRLPVAGLAARSLAWLIDATIKFFAIIFALIAFRVFGNLGIGMVLVLIFLTLWFYNVLFEVFWHGATPGKKALKLRVMNENGTPVGWTGSLLRNLIRTVDTIPGVYLFGCVSVLVSKNFQRLGDLAAGTIVVHDTRRAITSTQSETEPVAVKVPLSLDEQEAIVSFGERVARINVERTEELAALLKPVLGDVDAERLRGHASWLAGGDRTL